MSIHIRNYTNFLRIKFAASVLLFFCLHSSVSAGPDQRKSYLQIEQNKSSETNDLGITSIGALVFNGNTMGRGTLTQLKSDKNGDALALELGGGYVFNWDISLFLELGVTLGYNSGKSDYVAAYYPEAGIVVDLTDIFGISVSAKRYHHLYKEADTVVMIGLVFRK